jgi:hypothetical protein
LESYLRQKRSDLVRKWSEEALAIFPPDAMNFLRSVKDPFANPAGTTIVTEVEFLFDALLDDLPLEEIAPRLDRIIQLSSVQDVTPSRAVSFVFKLKEVLRGELSTELRDPKVFEWFLEFEARIDRLALGAFESYVSHRERLADIRVREVRNQVATLMRMTTIKPEDPASCTPARGGCGQ